VFKSSSEFLAALLLEFMEPISVTLPPITMLVAWAMRAEFITRTSNRSEQLPQ
jgi:hypothetical protein